MNPGISAIWLITLQQSVFWDVIGALDILTGIGLVVWPTYINMEPADGSISTNHDLNCIHMSYCVWSPKSAHLVVTPTDM